MYFLALIVIIGLIAIAGIRYDRAVRALVEYSSQHSLKIFGQYRKSRMFMMSTPSFFLALMSRQKVEATEDLGQRTLLQKVRRCAIAQLWISVLIAVIGLVIILMKTR